MYPNVALNGLLERYVFGKDMALGQPLHGQGVELLKFSELDDTLHHCASSVIDKFDQSIPH